MEQKEKEGMELKYIEPYLLHGLNFQCIDIESGEYEELPLTAIILTNGRQDLIIGNSEVDIDDLFANEYEAFYPILRPLSDLKRVIEVNGKKFVPNDTIKMLDKRYSVAGAEHGFIMSYPQWIIEKLFEYHFDVFGLIPKKLAVDINDL